MEYGIGMNAASGAVTCGATENPVNIAARELNIMLKQKEEERNQLQIRLNQAEDDIFRLNGAVQAMSSNRPNQLKGSN